jgi:RNA polymerase sigma-70 factor (ECF subfamily)
MQLLSHDELSFCIKGCARNERESQKKIYNSFYGYAMSICNCYTSNEEEAIEILNDGFLKIFRRIHLFKPAYTNELNSFKGWLRKIMVSTSIDQYRKNKKHRLVGELDISMVNTFAQEQNGMEKISYEEIIRSIQNLSPSYRTVLCLFILEGFSHEEISGHLGISIGTSKSNLAKARKQLQKILFNQNQIADIRNAG